MNVTKEIVKVSEEEPPGSEEPPSNKQEDTEFYIQRFKRILFGNVLDTDWKNWKWQIKNRIISYEQLNKVFDLSEEEKAVFDTDIHLPLAITPYYASLINPFNKDDPIRRCMVPVINETIQSDNEEEDPLHEESQSITSTLVHRYPDRVLFLTTKLCSSYCRYCTRSRIVGNCKSIDKMIEWNKNIEYIKNHPEIRDVLLSGGDPLMLSDIDLDWLLNELRKIAHVEIIRIGTKMPIVLPYRITNSLLKVIKKYHPIFMSIHCTHPNELTKDSITALNKLADSGIPLGSQTVLLKGINDNLDVFRRLVHGLLKNRVRPYYLYACDRIIGSSHFAASIEKGREIINGLRGFTSGYAIPTFVIDAPGGGGKVPVTDENIISQKDNLYLIKNYQNKCFQYS